MHPFFFDALRRAAHHRGPHHDHPHGGHHHGHGPHDAAVRDGFPFGGGGGRRERLFASGDLKLLVLHVLAQGPRHGYDIMKAIGELAGGDYTPSPGAVYPTLSMLEDLGQVAATQQDNGRKEYRITAEGEAQLQAQQELLERLLARVGQFREMARARRVPEVMRAMENLKMALRMRLGDTAPDAALARRVAEIIDRAAVEIERA